jgi:alkanesulfonate monooxygenase SsuD/methylene tetrahydromethanopterin reductase-like flavin-dependent oxidoreductase (luciferase family)
MRFGINLHNCGPPGHRVALTETVDAVDELGFDSVWVSDRLVMPNSQPGPYGTRRPPVPAPTSKAIRRSK